MKVTVVGKEHAAGKSRKTGKDFDANVVHVLYKKNGVDGQTVESIWLDPASYPLKNIEVGADYLIDRDSRGFLVDFIKA